MSKFPITLSVRGSEAAVFSLLKQREIPARLFATLDNSCTVIVMGDSEKLAKIIKWFQESNENSENPLLHFSFPDFHINGFSVIDSATINEKDLERNGKKAKLILIDKLFGVERYVTAVLPEGAQDWMWERAFHLKREAVMDFMERENYLNMQSKK